MSQTIGVITNNQHGVFQRDVITGITRVAAAQGYTCIVDSLAEEQPQPRPVSLKVADLAGLVVIANVMPDDFLQDVYRAGKPLVLVSHRVEDDMIPAVIPDNIEGMIRLVDYLVDDCQRNRIVFIQGDMHQNDGRQREKVFREQLLRHDLIMPEAFYLRGDFIPAVAAESLRSFLQAQHETFDAVAATDYLMAAAALEVLRAGGLRVPEDVCVVGFGDGELATQVGLTTIGVNVVELGQRAARQLLGQMNGLRMRGVTIISTEIIRRQTG
jgi:phosphoserine phosphatase RsbU/P